MIAKIRCNSGSYASVVFGFLGKGANTQAIVFSKDYSKLEIISYWMPKRNVVEFETNTADWLTQDSFWGYSWIYPAINQQQMIISPSAETLEKCKKIQGLVQNQEWHLVKDENDIENLQTGAINFHDAYVKKIWVEDDNYLILFGAWGCDILIELIGTPETNLYEGFGTYADPNDSGIFSSCLFFEKGYFIWLHNTNEPIQNYLDDNTKYFKAKYLRWKIIF